MSLEIVALPGPLGAEVRGVDLAAPLGDADRDRLQAAVDEYLVLVFRGGDRLPSNAEVVEFCGAFGTLRPTTADRSRIPDSPLINLVSNRVVDGVEGTGGAGVVGWHSDLHFEPPLVEMLYLDALKLPGAGGNTHWTNLCAAYDALDDATKGRIEDLGVTYMLRPVDFDGYFKASESYDRTQCTQVRLVQRNPRTGRRSIWPNCGPDLFVGQVIGMDPDESAELLGRLYAHAVRPEFVYTHEWRDGDACLWLNTQTMHSRDPFPPEQDRVLRHLYILGAMDPFQAAAQEANSRI